MRRLWRPTVIAVSRTGWSFVSIVTTGQRQRQNWPMPDQGCVTRTCADESPLAGFRQIAERKQGFSRCNRSYHPDARTPCASAGGMSPHVWARIVRGLPYLPKAAWRFLMARAADMHRYRTADRGVAFITHKVKLISRLIMCSNGDPASKDASRYDRCNGRSSFSSGGGSDRASSGWRAGLSTLSAASIVRARLFMAIPAWRQACGPCGAHRTTTRIIPLIASTPADPLLRRRNSTDKGPELPTMCLQKFHFAACCRCPCSGGCP